MYIAAITFTNRHAHVYMAIADLRGKGHGVPSNMTFCHPKVS